MAASINFLRERRKKLTKQQVLDQKLFKVFSGIGIGIFLVFLGSVGARLALAYNLNQITQKQNRMLQVVRSQEANEKSYVIFAAKLRVISELFVQRRDKQEAIKYFSTLFGPDVTVSDIAYEADSALLTFGLQAKNIFTLENVFGNLRNPQVKEQFAAVAASELRRDKTGSYQTTITVTLKSNLTEPSSDQASTQPTGAQ